MAFVRPEAFQLPSEDFNFSQRRELGSGGCAHVYAVTYRGQEVAMKVPYSKESSLQKEIANLACVSHKNVVRLLGAVKYEERICPVLELSHWGSVRDLLRSGALSFLRESRDSWLVDVAQALKYMHSDLPEKLIHGDLKGGNVLIFDTPRGQTIAKVSDFGQARALLETTSVEHMGTHLWSAPEILSEEGHSQKSDVWSFGCTAVEMISEKQPYSHLHRGKRREMRKVLRQVENREMDPLRDLQITWPLGLLPIVRRCLELHHPNRPSMEIVLRDLMAVDEERRPCRIAKFFIWWLYENSEDFYLDVSFRQFLFGKELRMAIAKKSRVDADRLKLQYLKARRRCDGAAVVWVVGPADHWADEQGQAVTEEDVESIEFLTILDDDAVGTAGPLRAWIRIEKT